MSSLWGPAASVKRLVERPVRLPVAGLFINGGWGTGGFKGTPGAGWVFADTIANDRPHKLNEAFSLARFSAGRLIDESAAAAVGH